MPNNKNTLREKIYQHIGKDGAKTQYRFKDGKCVGFFVDDKRMHEDKYNESLELTPQLEKNLKEFGFSTIKNN